MYLSHTDVSFPLFLPPFPSKINKENLLNKNLVPIDEGTKVAFILLSHKGGFSLAVSKLLWVLRVRKKSI